MTNREREHIPLLAKEGNVLALTIRHRNYEQQELATPLQN